MKNKSKRESNSIAIAPAPRVIITPARSYKFIGFSQAPNRQSSAQETQGHVLQQGVKMNFKRMEVDAVGRLAICTDAWGYVSIFRLPEIKFRIIG